MHADNAQKVLRDLTSAGLQIGNNITQLKLWLSSTMIGTCEDVDGFAVGDQLSADVTHERALG